MGKDLKGKELGVGISQESTGLYSARFVAVSYTHLVIEAICKDTKYLTEAEFYQLMDELLHDPACKFCDVVHEMVHGRAETAEAKEREFAEEEALLKAMQRGELPQGDE